MNYLMFFFGLFTVGFGALVYVDELPNYAAIPGALLIVAGIMLMSVSV